MASANDQANAKAPTAARHFRRTYRGHRARNWLRALSAPRKSQRRLLGESSSCLCLLPAARGGNRESTVICTGSGNNPEPRSASRSRERPRSGVSGVSTILDLGERLLPQLAPHHRQPRMEHPLEVECEQGQVEETGNLARESPACNLRAVSDLAAVDRKLICARTPASTRASRPSHRRDCTSETLFRRLRASVSLLLSLSLAIK